PGAGNTLAFTSNTSITIEPSANLTMTSGSSWQITAPTLSVGNGSTLKTTGAANFAIQASSVQMPANSAISGAGTVNITTNDLLLNGTISSSVVSTGTNPGITVQSQ